MFEIIKGETLSWCMKLSVLGPCVKIGNHKVREILVMGIPDFNHIIHHKSGRAL